MVALTVGVLASSPAPLALSATPPVARNQPAGFSAPANYIVHGIHLNPVFPDYPSEVLNFETSVAKPVGILMYYRAWDWPSQYNNIGPCDDNFLPKYAFASAIPIPGAPGGRAVMLTWDPLPILANPGPARYDNILSGQYDNLIKTCADELKLWSNKTFIIRFTHEMNIADSPWWAGQPYNQKPDGTGDTDKYKQVWRHVWQIFKNEGATNVQWEWSPNYASNPVSAWNDIHNYYPGDQYVDWIGMTGFNWMGSLGFQSFSDLYSAVIADFQCRYAKPIMLSEFGSAPYLPPNGFTPSSKETWIADAYSRARTFPLVRAVVWFNDYAAHNVLKADFRVWNNTNQGYNGTPETVPDSVRQAYANAMAASSFSSSPDYVSSQLLNPPMSRCPGDAVSGDGVLSARPTSILVARTGSTTGRFTIGAFGLGSPTAFTISGCPNGASCVFASSGMSTSYPRAAPWSGDTIIITANPSTALGLFTLTINGGGTSIQVQVVVLQRFLNIYLPLVVR